MVKWRKQWGPLEGTLGFIMFLSGFLSENVITMVIGLVLTFAAASAALTTYIRSDHIVKRALEVAFMFLAFGVVVYGSIVTRSLVLEVMTLFIIAIFFVAFTLSYLLPRIHHKPT
ncbi:MAG: hypothetical protein ACFFCW_25075 [Candidatus Hodarchaeota archaeon]